MNVSEVLKPGGLGVMATASRDGAVNTAVYAQPYMTGEGVPAWGMTDGRTYRNLRENPNASFLYKMPGGDYRGVRLSLKLREIRDSGEILDSIRLRTRESSGEAAANATKYVALFDIVEKRPLV